MARDIVVPGGTRMRNVIWRWSVLVVALWMTISTASAGTFGLSDVHGEADVEDEAGAVTLLVRTALAKAGQTIIDVPSGTTLETAPAWMATSKAQHVVVVDLARDGTGLRATTVVADGKDLHVARVRAGDGDLRALAKGIADHVTSTLSLPAVEVRDVGLARLRPFARAIRLRASDPTAAARALAEASPLVTLTVPTAADRLRGFAATVPDRTLSAIAARAIGDLAHLDQLATGTDTAARAAKAFAAAHRASLEGVDEVLKAGPPRDGGLAVARLVLAASRGDNKALSDRVKEALASDQAAGALAVVSLLAPGRLDARSQRLVLDRASKPGTVTAGIASTLGLGAAISKLEVPRALALVSVRELDEYEIKELEKLIAAGSEATVLRLRAELALRMADGSEDGAIAAYLAAAPTDPRANLYHGWVLMADDKHAEAAAAFAKAGARVEQARALVAAGDPEGALAVLGAEPKSPEHHLIAARVAIKQGRLDDAVRLIAIAEGAAPASPFVHLTVIELDKHKPQSLRAALAKRIALIDAASRGEMPDPTATPPTADRVAIGSGGGSGSGSASIPVEDATRRIEIDATPLAPVLELLPGLAALEDRRLVLAELPSSTSWASLREADPRPMRRALVKLLSTAPYRLQVTPEATPIAALDSKELAALTDNAPTALIYRVSPDGSDVEVTLMLYQRGAPDAAAVTKTIAMPGVVAWDMTKVVPLGVLLVVIVLTGLLYLTRMLNRVEIVIERAPDSSDEVLCIEISRSPTRPQVHDPEKFHAATKKAGTVTKPRSGTLVAGGETFKVPSGHWYVHLYGTYYRGGTLRRVPDTCTEEIEVKRGDRVEAKFSLTSKFAEVTVHMESEPRRGVAVWANDASTEKVFTDDAGDVTLSLPMGTHTIHIEAAGKRFETTVQVASAKMQRVGFNIQRELRIAQAVALDISTPVAAELELADGGTRALPTGHSAPRVEHAFAETAMPRVAFTSKPGTSPATPAAHRPHGPAAQPQPGDLLLGRYRLTAELGRGAMGVVHRAFDEKLEREVAIKEMADDLKTNPEAMRLFTQEAKALAQLNHTNIVAMYDQVTEGGKVYMIMEFVEGKPLADLLHQRGTFPWRDAVAIIDQVCAGLAYAHARKVIHRDIKPANIFVTKDRVAKLGDFGLARVMREVTIQRTEIRGTPLYMAPEQITGTGVDHRSDLYAVGCMFFELVCGRPPFVEGDILYAHMHTPPPSPRHFCPDLPPSLDDLIQTLIAKASDDRPGSANEVRTALKAV